MEDALLFGNYEEWIVTAGYNDSVVLGQNVTNISNRASLDVWWDYGGEDTLRHSRTITFILIIAYVLILIIGVVGNSLVVCVVVRSPRMRTVTNLFIVNLAIADLLVVLFCLPPTLLSNILVRKWSTIFFCNASMHKSKAIFVYMGMQNMLVQKSFSSELFFFLWRHLINVFLTFEY